MRWILEVAAVLASVPPTLSSPNIVGDAEASAVQGSCRRADGKFLNLGEMLVLETRRLSLKSAKSVIAIEGEKAIVITNSKRASESAQIVDVSRIVRPPQDLDIELRFVLMNGGLNLYWRETFQHRSYSQGLLTFANGKFVPLCIGTGGVDQSH